MDRFVVAVFPDETKAYEGVHAMRELHAEGSLSLYATVVVGRDAKGEIAVKSRDDVGPLGLGVGALTGGLIGIIGGPVGAAVGFAAGGLAGSFGDIAHFEVSDDFLETVKNSLTPGKFAVIAEVEETWATPLDTRLEALGAVVTRAERDQFVRDRVRQRIESVKKDLAERRAELASARAKRMEKHLTREIESTQKKLELATGTARKLMDEGKRETEAKIRALEAQADKANPDVRVKVQKRITELRRDLQAREEKLDRAYEVTQEALHA